MAKSKSGSLPPSRSLDELVEYFDTHDMGDDWEEMPEAHLVIDIKKKAHLVAIDEELMGRLSTIAKAKRVPTEALIHSWLQEKMLAAS